jgi:hypothetical protein
VVPVDFANGGRIWFVYPPCLYIGRKKWVLAKVKAFTLPLYTISARSCRIWSSGEPLEQPKRIGRVPLLAGLSC